MEEVQEEKEGKEREKRVEFEAGMGEVKRKDGQLPPGWEWVWMEDPWTRMLRLETPSGPVGRRRKDS